MSIQNKKQGWISVHRQITDHWLWKEKPFSRAQAWIDLILMANHTPNKFVLGNELMEVDRGQLITSEVKLMERWGWSKSKLRNFLKLLQEDRMIVKKSDNKKTTLTICQYSDWQDLQNAKSPAKEKQESKQGEPQEDTNNNVVTIINNLNNEERRLAKNLIFCYKKAFNDLYFAEYKTTPEDAKASPQLAAMLKEAATLRRSVNPWEWIYRYFKKCYDSELLNDYHKGRLSIAHIKTNFQEIHPRIFPNVSIPNKQRHEERFVDDELKDMGMIPTIPTKPPEALPVMPQPHHVTGDAEGLN